MEQHAFPSRIQFPPFVENQADIEKAWDPHFGDRKTGNVIIGQDLDELAHPARTGRLFGKPAHCYLDAQLGRRLHGHLAI